MFTRILVPVDLLHVDQIEKALRAAAELSRLHGIPICYVGVTAPTPGPVGHNPEEFAARLEAFAAEQSKSHGLADVSARAYTSHDPTADLHPTLMTAIEETESDLVVVASHIPGFPEYLFASNAGYLAMHATVSVFVIR